MKRLRKIREEDLEKIMDWRMRPDITKFMYTDPKLTMEDQLAWFRKISAEEDSFYWIYEIDGKAVGLVCLVDWDKENSVIHTGGYIAEKDGNALRNNLDMNMNLYDYTFRVLGVNRAVLEIMDNNLGLVQWMKRIGARQEGILRQAIQKNGAYHDLYLLSFLREEWPAVLERNHFERAEIE